MALTLSSKSSNPLLLPMLALVAGFIAVKSYLPRAEAANQPKRAQLAQLQASTREMTAMDPATVAATRAEMEREQAAVAAKEQGIPVSLDAGTLLRQLDAAAHRHSLALSALQPAESDAGVPAAAIAPYRGESYSVKVSGSWSSIVSLLADWRTAQPGALPSIRSVRATSGAELLVADIVFTMVTRAAQTEPHPVGGPGVVPTPGATPRPAASAAPVAASAQSGMVVAR